MSESVKEWDLRVVIMDMLPLYGREHKRDTTHKSGGFELEVGTCSK